MQFIFSMEDIGILEGPFESAEFLPHMTPLMLACHENNYEVVQLLLHHDYTIRVPAPDSCKCGSWEQGALTDASPLIVI